ncbi:galactose-3-O-sulfotransferase 2-like [Macrobrachium nipponense]|uniref:galactose-3-O-sulfotransferase 2-like n=1 Tax=Macrobrachium nipponense TaxID=159736 RepID=UPI0030C8007E
MGICITEVIVDLGKTYRNARKRRGMVIIFILALGSFFLWMETEYLMKESDSAQDPFFHLRGRKVDGTISHHFVSKAFSKIQTDSASLKCQPLFNIMYLKTHKCASSTMQNILFRYACTHNQRHETITCGQFSDAELTGKVKADHEMALGKSSDEQVNGSHLASRWREEDPIFVAVPYEGVYAGSPARFRAEILQYPKWLLPPSGMVNMFGLHTRMDAYELQKILHRDSLWFTVLRHPIQLYTSLFTYFKINGVVGGSLNHFLKRPLSEMRTAKRLNGNFGANQMTFDLGYDPDVFYDDDKIDDMIRDVEDTFDLVLIAERLDESLILLGHALCWSLDDLVSLSKNVRSTRQSLTSEEQTKLEELNYSDMRLYRHFSSQFEELTQRYGKKKLEEEVAALRAERQRVESYCVESKVAGHHKSASIKEYSADVFGFKLSHPEDPLCRALAWNSKHYISYFRDLMKKRFGQRQAGPSL